MKIDRAVEECSPRPGFGKNAESYHLAKASSIEVLFKQPSVP
jgi:hypothetical protein